MQVSRFPAFYSLIGVLRKRYDADLVKEVITLEKLDFKHKKANLDLDFLVSYRTNSVTQSSYSSKFLINN